MHALNHTAKWWACWVLVAWLCGACAIQSGAQIVAMRPDPDTWAWAMTFVGSTGQTQRELTGLAANTRYRIAIQAQIVTGHLRLTVQPQPNTPAVVLQVYPARPNTLTAEVTSNQSGTVVIAENSYDARGGEYQVWLYTMADQ